MQVSFINMLQCPECGSELKLEDGYLTGGETTCVESGCSGEK